MMTGAFWIAGCVGAGQTEAEQSDTSLKIVYAPDESDSGRCKPHGMASVNKAATGLYKIHGENYYIDTRTGESTNIPLQFVFQGADVETGMSNTESFVGINTDTPCKFLRIRSVVQYCLYEEDRRAEIACREDISLTADGYEGVEIVRNDLE